MPPTPVVLGPRAEFIEKNLGLDNALGYVDRYTAQLTRLAII